MQALLLARVLNAVLAATLVSGANSKFTFGKHCDPLFNVGRRRPLFGIFEFAWERIQLGRWVAS